jgi:thiamine biosynthesis protein ThiI
MLVLVRLAGEVATKSRRVRARFQRRLARNIRDALGSAGLDCTVSDEWSRLFVELRTEGKDAQSERTDEADGQAATALEALSRVFGIRSLSMVERRCAADLNEIVRVGEEAYADAVRGKTFAVRARRTGEHPFRSQDIHVQLGAALNRYATVNLGAPDVTVHVEVRPDEAFFFSRRVEGPGGLPVGVEGRAVALISGGFDSAVAAWLMLKRGVQLDYVLCNLAGAAYERSVLRVVKVLAEAWSCGTRPRLHVVDFDSVVTALRRDVKGQYVQVVLKRLMYRVGVRIAELLGAHAVITGESVGQVSSQTLANLRAIDEVATLPVLRPLVGMDKEEIIAQTHRIGTYALSASVQEYCALVAAHPVTAARLEAVRREESRLDLEALEPLIAERTLVDVRSLSAAELVVPYLFTSEVPDGAVVIDCRPAHHYRAWHYPGAIHHELDALLMGFRKLDRAPTYVLYCAFGLQSAAVAEKMQRAGYEAYSFQGGSAALREDAEARAAEKP